MKHLIAMKENLVRMIENEMGHLEQVDTKELGEAIDMVKDLSEAIYYCTVTEAMESKKYDMPKEYREYRYDERKMHEDTGRMYYNSMPMTYTNNGGGTPTSYNMNTSMQRDYREGRSPEGRRSYMEAKEMKQPKPTQMHELEKYLHELGTDITEMIEDATPEEKSLIEKKLTGLAQKVVQ